MVGAAALAALKGKSRQSPQTESARSVRPRVAREKEMQPAIQVAWAPNKEGVQSIMAFAALSPHDGNNLFKTNWVFDINSNSNKPADSDATAAAKNANLFLDSMPASFGFMYNGENKVKFCAQNVHYLRHQINWLRLNAEASDWPAHFQLDADLPPSYNTAERIQLDIFLCNSIDILTQLSPGEKSNLHKKIYNDMVKNATGTRTHACMPIVSQHAACHT